MPRRTWTTVQQKDWLDLRKAAFIEAKEKGHVAVQELCSTIFKEFRENWPLPPVTEEETTAAGSTELATKIKRDKHDKRVREWFHNNTRVLTSNTGPSGTILKVKARPKMLQDWQAYHALTYETQWKTHIDKEWARYKNDWELQNPTVKPPKTRFTIMVEFIKEKFKNETEEMKLRCDEYRQARKSETPVPNNSQEEKNLQFQSGIDKLPRTLATIGESIMEQTGWHVTIMAGGPTPNIDGNVMTYLSHSGKTKKGDKFDGHLGEKQYDGLLRDFEMFLHASFSEEDRAARSLVKCEPQDESENVELKGSTEEDLVDEDEDSDDDNYIEEGGNNVSTAKSANKGISEYAQRREKNIAELKTIIERVKAKYPMPEITKAQGRGKKSTSKSAAATLSKIATNLTAEVALPVTLTSNSVTVIQNASPADINNLESHATNTSTSLTGSISEDDRTIIVKDSINEANEDLPASPTLTVLPIPKEPDSLSVTDNESSSPVYFNNSETPRDLATNSASDTSTSSGSIQSSSRADINDSETRCDLAADFTIHTSTSISASEDCTTKSDTSLASPLASAESVDTDVVMQDTTSLSGTRNDENLPTWLSQMIVYLRGVSDAPAWHDLVSGFVEFEKGRPPHGNLPTKLRPREVSNWIRSKNKNSVPSVEIGPYGKLFKEWWVMMQPSWRDQGGPLVRDVPQGETWQTLRKGGTAGIYIVIIGLSWLIKAEQLMVEKLDTEAWTLVDDISWVVKQMTKGMDLSERVSQKRAHDGDDKNLPRKSRRHSKNN